MVRAGGLEDDDLGATWTHSSAGLTYGDGEGVTPIKTIWSLATTADGALLAGVEPAGLFRSEDDGATWTHVRGLTDHPVRDTWQPGAGGLILHTIIPHPDDRAADVGRISSVGVFETRTAARRGSHGTRASARLQPGSGSDHRPVRAQVRGGGGRARDALPAEPLRDVPLARRRPHLDRGHPQRPAQPVRLPAGEPPARPGDVLDHPAQRRRPRPFRPRRQARGLEDARTAATPGPHADGLPQESAYLSVLREAMARDTLDPVGVTFGTKTGQLWQSTDEGARGAGSRPTCPRSGRSNRSSSTDGRRDGHGDGHPAPLAAGAVSRPRQAARAGG